jgi:hypothetical protein
VKLTGTELFILYTNIKRARDASIRLHSTHNLSTPINIPGKRQKKPQLINWHKPNHPHDALHSKSAFTISLIYAHISNEQEI